MPDPERLLGALEEFKKTQVEFNRMFRKEFDKLHTKIDDINRWRWKLEGIRLIVASMSGLVGGAAITIFFKRILS